MPTRLHRFLPAQLRLGRLLFTVLLALGLGCIAARAQSIEGQWNFVGHEFDSEVQPIGVGRYERFSSTGTVTFTALGGDNYRVISNVVGEGQATEQWSIPRVGNTYVRTTVEAPQGENQYREILRIVPVDADTMTMTYSGGNYWLNNAFPHHPNRIFRSEMGAFILRRAALPAPIAANWSGNVDLVEYGGSVASFSAASSELIATSKVRIGSSGGNFTISRSAGGAQADTALALSATGTSLISERTVPSVGSPQIFAGPPIAVFGRNAHEALAVVQVDASRVAVIRYRGQLGNAGTPDINFNGAIVLRAEVSVGIGTRVVDTAPAITQQPADLAVLAGGDGFITVAATGGPVPTFVWERSTDNGATWFPIVDGADYSGTATKTLVIRRPTLAVTGHRFRVRATNSVGSVTSTPATLKVLSTATARLPNLSLRTDLAAAQTLIVGFVMSGGSKPVMIRAVGPTLGVFGVSGVQTDPLIELYNSSGTKLLENDDWAASSAATFAQVGAFALAAGSKDAALGVALQGAATAQVKGKVGGGVVLVEVYDAGTGNSTRLANVSARNFVGTGDKILIAGFVVTGDDPKNLLIRAVGPTLAGFGVSGTLADPAVEIYDGNGVRIAANDNWDASLAPVSAAAGGFALLPASRDAALHLTLRPGAYTAQVRGADGGTGEALIELYELP